MKIASRLKRVFLGAALAGALLVAAPHKAEAQRVGFGISIGGPVYGGFYAPGPYAYAPGYYPYAYGYPRYGYGGYYGPRFYGRGYGYGRPFYGYGRSYGYGRGGYGRGFRR